MLSTEHFCCFALLLPVQSDSPSHHLCLFSNFIHFIAFYFLVVFVSCLCTNRGALLQALSIVSELPHRFPLLASLPSQKFPIGPAGCGRWAGESMCDILGRRKFAVALLYQTSVQCWGRTNTPCSSLGPLTLALVLQGQHCRDLWAHICPVYTSTNTTSKNHRHQ